MLSHGKKVKEEAISIENWEILKLMDKIVPYAELDKKRWKDLLNEFKDCVIKVNKNEL